MWTGRGGGSTYGLATVVNLDRGTIVAERCRVARSLLRRVLGLHLLPPLAEGDALLLPRASSMDTTFMRYPIDVAFLDKVGVVRRTVDSMPPWRMVAWARGARDCLELPAGALRASATTVGDRLAVRPMSEG
ncbi:MAG: DUF192 domain-containing protein [Chloroflexota bacterium]|nr:DUF192 domain-containing protein [Chloroflexota bacterium]